MRKKIVAIIVMMIFAQSVYWIANAQTDPFDRVEKVLRQNGKGTYREGIFLNKDIIKGKYAYCVTITERPVRWNGRKYVPDTESSTCVTMWKEHYDERKGPREGKIIIWVIRTVLGSYEAQISKKIDFLAPRKRHLSCRSESLRNPDCDVPKSSNGVEPYFSSCREIVGRG